jgi:hypothetical protein
MFGEEGAYSLYATYGEGAGAMVVTPAVEPVARALLRSVAAYRRTGIVLPSPRRTPFTFWYLVVLLGTTIVLRSVAPPTAQRLLEWSSTNVTELSAHPLRVLVFSALWLPGLVWAPYAVMYTVVIAPVERAVGGRWTAMVFLSGHLLATLLTEVPIAIMIWLGHLGRQWATVLDVGVSYGLFTTLGVLLGLLVPRARWIGLAVVEAGALLWLALDRDLDGVGHLIAINLGLLWWRWLAGRGVFGTIAVWSPLRRPATSALGALERQGRGQPADQGLGVPRLDEQPAGAGEVEDEPLARLHRLDGTPLDRAA